VDQSASNVQRPILSTVEYISPAAMPRFVIFVRLSVTYLSFTQYRNAVETVFYREVKLPYAGSVNTAQLKLIPFIRPCCGVKKVKVTGNEM